MDYCKVNLLFMNYKKEANNVLDFKKFTVSILKKSDIIYTFHKEIMDEIKEAGWTRFKPVEGQPMAEQDLKKVFKMVDMDGSGQISPLVGLVHGVYVYANDI